MVRIRYSVLLLLVLSLTSLATATHAQVSPSFPGGSLVAGTPSPEKTSLSTLLQVRPAGLDLSAVENWLRTASWWSAGPRPAAALRARRAAQERVTHRAL